jgi:hypothetical protein
MKKTVRKLKLQRETLQTLERPELQNVGGGASTPDATCGSCQCAFGAMDGYIRG